MKYFFFTGIFFSCIFYSCNKFHEQDLVKEDSLDFGLLKPHSITPMGKPEIHTVNFDSLEEVKFSVTIEQPKLGEKFLNPQLASYPPVINTMIIDSSSVKTLILGTDVPFPKTYIIPKTGYQVQHGDTIYAPVKTKAKHPESKTIGAMRPVPNSIKDITYFDREAGLPYSSFQCVLEDSKGYIWFGSTGIGLIRYDGNSFWHYHKNHGIYGSRVYSMFEDNDKNLWIGFKDPNSSIENGITRYDGVNFINYDVNQGFSSSGVTAFYEDSHGALWLATQKNGIIVYKNNNNRETITKYTTKNGLLSNEVYSLLEDQNGLMWIGTIDGVCIFDGKKFTSFTQKKEKQVRSILQDSKGDIWYSNHLGICKYDGKSIVQYQEDKHSRYNVSMVMDDQRVIWMVNFNKGLSFYDGANFGMIDTEHGIKDPKIKKLTKDKSGNIWMSTFTSVSKFKVNSFNNYTNIAGLSNSNNSGLALDKVGNIWMSGNRLEGLIKYDHKHFQHYSLKNTRSRFIYTDRTKNFWFSDLKNRVHQFTKFDGHKAYNYKITGFDKTNRVTSITQDPSGVIWIGAIDGLYQLDGDRMVKFGKKEGVPARIIKMSSDKKGNLWLCTRNGLSMFDGNQFHNYTESNGLFKNFLSNFMFDSNDNLFISTLQGLSLLTINPENAALTHSYNYGNKNNLDPEVSLTLLEDKDQNIWAGSPEGINRLSPTNQFGVYKKISFNKEDGFLGGRGQINSVILDEKNNTIWWGASGGGAVTLNLDKYDLNNTKPKIHLNELHINNKFIDFNRLEDTTYIKTIPFDGVLKKAAKGIVKFQNYPLKLELPYELNHLKFNFSAMDWKFPSSIKYQYLLKGIDRDWSSLTTDNFAEYKNMSHGDYTFRVKARGKTGLWSETLSYDFTISPPWWHTWWARIGYLLLGVLLVYWIVKLRANAIRKEFAEKERFWAITEKQNKRFMDFSFVTSHNIRIAAANFSGLLNLLKKETNSEIVNMLKSTSTKLGSSIEHMNQLLHTDDFIKETQKELYSISSAIDKALLKNQGLIEKKAVLLEIDVSEDIKVLTLNKYLDNIVNQLFKNALIFGVTDSQKKVKIFTEKENGILILTVKDYGLGIDMESHKEEIFKLGKRFHPDQSEGDGLGLYISKNQAVTLGWDIIVESEVGKGSTFKVCCYD